MYRIGGRLRNKNVSFCGVALGIPPLLCWGSNRELLKHSAGQCQAGSLTGAVASQKVTEAREGHLKANGNRQLSVRV